MTELRRGNQFFEYGEYNDNMYGTSVDSVRSVIEQHKMCVLDIQPAVSTHTLKSHMLQQVCQQAVNMLMKRNFVQYFVDCIGRISLNSNITSQVELLSLSKYSTLLDMRITQPPTSYCMTECLLDCLLVAYINEE